MACGTTFKDPEEISVALAEVEARRLELEDQFKRISGRTKFIGAQRQEVSARAPSFGVKSFSIRSRKDEETHPSIPRPSPFALDMKEEEEEAYRAYRVGIPLSDKKNRSPGHTLSTTSPPSPTGDQSELAAVLNAMRLDRQVSDQRLVTLMEAIISNRSEGINKAIPQVQPMKEREDLHEFFQLFEYTQQARRTPREAWAATLLPLLNTACKSLAMSLPAEVQCSYTGLKTELLAQADSRTDDTIQVFWEHKKA